MTWLWWAGTLIPFGFLTPILFTVAARRVHKRAWLGWAALYGVATYGGLVATFIGADDSDLDGAGSLAMVIVWVAGSAHAFAARFEYARLLRNPLRSPVDAAREVVERRKEAQRLAAREPHVALEMGLGRPDRPGATHMNVVDVNRAPAGVIATLPGISDQLAREIVAAREEIDGFDTVVDLGEVLRLDVGVVEDLRPYVVFLPR